MQNQEEQANRLPDETSPNESGNGNQVKQTPNDALASVHNPQDEMDLVLPHHYQEYDYVLPSPANSYSEVLRKVEESVKSQVYAAAVLPPIKNRANRLPWEPNLNPTRKVNAQPLIADCEPLKLAHHGKKICEGLTVTKGSFFKTFQKNLASLPDKMQLIVLLTDDRSLVGYVKNTGKSTTKIYFPANLVPKEIELPLPGYSLCVRVKALIMG